jgi:putative ABC transport system ATP-binding protein
MTTIVRTEALALHFDDGQTRALEGVSIAIREGEFVAVTGPSGCGKSSLLNLIGTLDTPSAGELYFRNLAYSGMRDRSLFRRNNIGFVFQAFQLLPTLSALDNVLVPSIGVQGTSHRAHAQALLDRLGMSHRLNHLPGKLSGGERQRIAIARALINNPALILADEPTGSLDSANAGEVLDLIGQLQQERNLTVIMVTHDANVSALADRIIRMRDGRTEEQP